MKLRRAAGATPVDVELLSHRDRRVTVRIDDREVSAVYEPLPDGSSLLLLNERRFLVRAVRLGDEISAAAGPQSFQFRLDSGSRIGSRAAIAAPEIVAPMPGKVLKILVEEEQQVSAGEPILVMEAMKMETTLAAEGPATIKRIAVTAGQMVDAGALLIELRTPSHPTQRQSVP